MVNMWLTPVVSREPLTFGTGRLPVSPSPELTAFREKMNLIHPRFVSMFKAELLTSGEYGGDDVCGPGGQDEYSSFCVSLNGDVPLVFDGKPWDLSHCGQSFVDRLPSVGEVKEWLAIARTLSWSDMELSMLALIDGWNLLGYDVVWIREG